MSEPTKDRKTPGVYVTELSAFPPAVVGVATAVPIFIGYTQSAINPVTKEQAYLQAIPLTSMIDYYNYFGQADSGTLETQLQMFYSNGGGNCFVVSVGDDTATPTVSALLEGLKVAGASVGPTMTVVPDACQLDQADYASVVQTMVTQAATLQDRVAILDLPGCLTATDYPALLVCQSNLWAALGPVAGSLSYAAAYAPALLSTVGGVVAPSGAMAGIWTANDGTRGVWNAPANLTIASVINPQIAIDDSQQADFNAPLNGMAIDILRAMVNRGTVVWGARTLDGNSNDYRYIQVRRTLIYVEQSIKTALQQFVFAANDATTWATVTTTISNFLTQLWEQGGLMGAKASDAFTVACGVPVTMTQQDVLNGYMILNVTLQMIHPAEFIELTFTQTMQVD